MSCCAWGRRQMCAACRSVKSSSARGIHTILGRNSEERGGPRFKNTAHENVRKHALPSVDLLDSSSGVGNLICIRASKHMICAHDDTGKRVLPVDLLDSSSGEGNLICERASKQMIRAQNDTGKPVPPAGLSDDGSWKEFLA
eukprot:210390-Pelagomonas_calceolata.AAC.5